jgi:crotonobetainyl-CoA:carnitine CoA-transferase CaiB-like acyl-CoA transferase
VIDLALYEPMLTALGSMVIDFDQLGIVQGRTGNRAPFTAPRNAYQCKDGGWFAISASNQNTAERLLRVVGGDELVNDDRFATNAVRVEYSDDLDKLIENWAISRTLVDVLATFNSADVPVSPVNSVQDLLGDAHVMARESVVTVADPELGPVQVQATIPRFSATPGSIRHLGKPVVADNSDVDVDHPW